MFLFSALYNSKRALVVLGLGALALIASGCSQLIGTITTEPPPSPPKILDVQLKSDHKGYGETKIKIDIEFTDQDRDMGENGTVSYKIEQVMQAGDFCWILPRPRSVLKREPIEGKIQPERVTWEPGGITGTITIRVDVAIWPENAHCTAQVTVTLTDKSGNSSAPRSQIIRLFEGYI